MAHPKNTHDNKREASPWCIEVTGRILLKVRLKQMVGGPRSPLPYLLTIETVRSLYPAFI